MNGRKGPENNKHTSVIHLHVSFSLVQFLSCFRALVQLLSCFHALVQLHTYLCQILQFLLAGHASQQDQTYKY